MTLPQLRATLPSMNIKAIIALLLLIAAVALFWFFNPASGQDVAAVKPVRSAAVQAVYATGTVEASLMIPIAPKVAARLMTLNVDEGARVSAGDVLAQMEDTDLLQAAADAKAKMDLAQKDLTRAQRLLKSGAVSREGFDSAQAAHKSAVAAYERAKAEMDYLKLLAPEAGTIIRRDGEIGELITLGTPVFWMNGGDKIRIATEVDEEDIGLVQTGQHVAISADAFPGQIFDGTVLSITPKGDPVARSYRVRVGFDEQSPLMIGMTAETNIITQEKEDALMVPLASVNNGYILKIAAGRAKNVAVKTGIKTPQAIEIIEGITEGDMIAEKYDATLLDKKRLNTRVREEKN